VEIQRKSKIGRQYIYIYIYIGSETGRPSGEEEWRARDLREELVQDSLHRRKKYKHRLHDSLRFDATQVQPVRKYYYYYYYYFRSALRTRARVCACVVCVQCARGRVCVSI